MGWFSGKDLSASERSKILAKVLEDVRNGAKDSLRALIAKAIGGRTGPDDKLVTSIMSDIVSYGLPSTERAKSTDLSGWWTQADIDSHAKALESAVACLK